MTVSHFADDLYAAVQRKNSRLVVGLDPHWPLIPASIKQARPDGDFKHILCRFFLPVIEECHELAAAFKPQIAFFEQFGIAGLEALIEILAAIRQAGGMVVMDGKRNDIGSTAAAYATAFFGDDMLPAAFPSDALTVNAYLGDDGLKPFLVKPEKGIFALVKTSNPSSGQLQDQKLAEGGTVAEAVAAMVDRHARASLGRNGFGNAGAVIGATYPQHMRALRQKLPHSWLLVPGYGAQGGDDEAIRAAFTEAGTGALINSSRGILFPADFERDGFRAVARAARQARDHINTLAGV